MTILIGVLVYVVVVVAMLSFFRFVHRSDDVIRALHAELPTQEHGYGSPVAQNKVA